MLHDPGRKLVATCALGSLKILLGWSSGTHYPNQPRPGSRNLAGEVWIQHVQWQGSDIALADGIDCYPAVQSEEEIILACDTQWSAYIDQLNPRTLNMEVMAETTSHLVALRWIKDGSASIQLDTWQGKRSHCSKESGETQLLLGSGHGQKRQSVRLFSQARETDQSCKQLEGEDCWARKISQLKGREQKLSENKANYNGEREEHHGVISFKKATMGTASPRRRSHREARSSTCSLIMKRLAGVKGQRQRRRNRSASMKLHQASSTPLATCIQMLLCRASTLQPSRCLCSYH